MRLTEFVSHLELSQEQERAVHLALNGHNAEEVLVNAFNVNIMRRDVQTLRGLNWLNDEVINFYMTLICERSQQPNSIHELKVHAFNTFFYPKLTDTGYSSVSRWTKKVDIFAHDLIIIPVSSIH